MEQNIYLDVYFCFNFLMDFFVIFFTGILIKNNKSLLRIVFSAIIGAAYAVVILVLNYSETSVTYNLGGIGKNLTYNIDCLEKILTYMVVVYLMVLVAFGKYRLRTMLRHVLLVYVITFMLSGIINMIYYSSGAKNFSSTKVIVITIVVEITLVCIYKARQNRESILSYYSVTIAVDNKKISVIGLVDTGNSLVESVTQKPVSIIESSSLGFEPTKILFVPYNSVGKKHGIMQAFVADYMTINGKIIEKQIIAIHRGNFSGSKDYQLILHPKTVKGD